MRDCSNDFLGERKQMTRKLLGEILREHGKVTDEQIREALDRQLTSDKVLGHILYDMGIVTDDDIAYAWSEQLGTETIDLSETEIPQEVISRMPRELAERHNVMPVKLKDGVLLLAMSDPVNVDALKSISALYDNAEIKPVASSALGIAHAILRCYQK